MCEAYCCWANAMDALLDMPKWYNVNNKQQPSMLKIKLSLSIILWSLMISHVAENVWWTV